MFRARARQIRDFTAPPHISKSSFLQGRRLAPLRFSRKLPSVATACIPTPTRIATKIPRLGTLELCDLNSRQIKYVARGSFSCERPPNRTSAVPNFHSARSTQRTAFCRVCTREGWESRLDGAQSSDGARLARRCRAEPRRAAPRRDGAPVACDIHNKVASA